MRESASASAEERRRQLDRSLVTMRRGVAEPVEVPWERREKTLESLGKSAKSARGPIWSALGARHGYLHPYD